MATSDLNLLETHLQDWRELLILWATNGTLSRAAQTALQLEGEPEKLRELVEEWSKGDFRNLPPVVLMPASAMPGAAGAYAISTGTIYLNGDWLASASEDRVIAVLTEELGHYLDGLLNASDTPGDEGDLFAALINREGLGDAALPAVNSQDDSSIIFLSGQAIQVENASTTAVEALNKLLGRIGITDPGGNYPGECVSFVKQYARELGFTMGTMGASPENPIKVAAENGFRNFNRPGNSLSAAQADKIIYTGTQVPKIGDIIFFDGATYGHVAVVQNVLDSNRVIVQESNIVGKQGNSRVSLGEIKLNTLGNSANGARGSVMGWLRLKNIAIGGTPSLPPISNPSLTPITTTQLPLLVGNINGDGQKDIVFRRPNGDIKGVLLDSEGKFNWALRVGSADKNLPLVGIGDINGDGRDDVVFRDSNGDVTSFRTNSSGAASEYYRVGGADANLPVIGVSDITGDGRAEVIFRAPNGDVNAFRNGADGVAFQYYRVGGAGSDLPVVAIGDISGDRRSEILFRSANGDVNAFRMGADGVATQYYRVGFADPSIKLVGIGDITGDGRGEVIFRAPNGDVGAFLTGTDGVATLWYVVGWADPSLPIVGIGDTTGDGRSEIFFRQPNGYLGAFRINSSGIADLYYQTDVADPAAVDFGYSTPTITAGLQTEDQSGLGLRVLEGNSGFSTITFDVSVDNATGDTVFVNYATENGTAIAGADYSPVNGTLAFTSGQKVKQVSIQILGDVLFEPDKSFRFVLSNAVGGSINNSISEVTILNDDIANGPPTALSVSAMAFNENIAAGSTVATLATTDPDAGNTFTYSLVSGAGDTDNGAFSISGNQFSIKASPDFEAKSSYSVRLRSTDQGGLSFERAVIFNVIDVNEPVITLSISPTSVTEDGTSNLVYTFSRTGATTSALTVNYTVGGTATLGTDYTGIAATPAVKTVTFAANSSTAKVTVDPTADTTIEANETVALTLATGTGYSIGTTAAVVGTIINDDIPTTTTAITAVNDNVGLIQGVVAAGARTDDTTPTITGTISAALAAGETLRIFNGATLLGSATVNNTNRTWSYIPTLPASAGTTYNITARVADAAGNLGTASSVRSFIVDTTAPLISAGPTATGASGISITSNENGTAALYKSDGSSLFLKSTTANNPVILSLAAQSSLTTATLQLRDAVGNSTTAQSTFIIGTNLTDSLTGTRAANFLYGFNGNDTLDGLAGNDTLTGGLGSDTFRFSSTLNSTTNRDRITDFNVTEDRIQLENAVFTGLPTTGTLAATAFIIGSSFTTSAQRIRYDSTSGQLLYDSDGNGISASVNFATLTTGLILTNSQFNIT